MLTKRAKYIKERENLETYEDEAVLIEYCYFNEDNTLYIANAYVEPQYRGEKRLRQAYTKILRDHLDVKYVMASVDKATNGWTNSLSMLEHDGFKPVKTVSTMIYLIKDL